MRKKYHRFLQKNRNRGISNLMLYIALGNALVYLFALFSPNASFLAYLPFSAERILSGEVWRCVTWVFTYALGFRSNRLGLLYLFFYVMYHRWLGQVLEGIWGTLRLNIYYLGGSLMTVVTAILIYVFIGIGVQVTPYYMDLSLLLAVATLIPEQRVTLFGIFPIKMRWLAVVNVVLTVLNILVSVQGLHGTILYIVLTIFCTAPMIAILNYVLTFGKDVLRLFSLQTSLKQRKRRQQFKQAAQPNPDWAKNYRNSAGEGPYRHKCTVCGRTDTKNPGLEFRYCSRCKGYHCYCIEHINQHTHIE